jgi:hypothetical protein
MLKRREHVRSFEADDEQGIARTLHVWVDIIAVPNSAVAIGAEVRGGTSIMTDDGQSVNALEKGKYQVVGTDEILRSNDPDAP